MPFQTRQRLTWAGCVLVGVCMLASPAASRTPDPLTLQAQLEQVQKLQQATTDELKAQNKELQERLKAQETALLETQRKSIDWWFSLLGAAVGALAVMFGALPLLLTRQQKADIEKELTSAKDLVASIRGHEQQARDTSEKLNSYVSGQPQSAAQQVEINREIASIQRSSTATDTDKLRARAIQASEVDNPTTAQAQAAFDLWKALTLLVPQDASAHFNAAYWAHELFDLAARPSKAYWFDTLASFYGQALQLQPSKSETAYNWGNALNTEARFVAKKGDMGMARVLWRQAGEKYALALQIEPDDHQTAYNWGSALDDEANVVADEGDTGMARVLWRQAGEKYALALQIEPDKHEAANNWGVSLGNEAQTVAAQDLGAARVLWQQAGEKYVLALQIKPDMHEAASNWGAVLAAEAKAVADEKDMGTAQVLWRQAGEKYAQALKIKPDMHKAASNWGSALAAEAKALQAVGMHDAAASVIRRAATLLEQHMAVWPDARRQLAYNLACVYGLQCRPTDAVAQLEAARQADELPDHWPTDPDLDPIRTSTDYLAWVSQHFPNPIPTDTNASKGT